METRRFGDTDLNVTVIGFGAMTIGGAFGAVDDQESLKALHGAIDAGVNFIDTSNAYGEGRSESLIGTFLAERSDRDDIAVFSKGGNNMVTRTRDFTPAYIQQCLEDSLRRLGRTIDFYMLHNPSVDNMSAEDSYDVLERAKDAGKIRHWGVSVNSVAECELAVKQGSVAGMQMEYNILNQAAAPAFSHASDAGVGVISRVPLGRGFLADRFSVEHQFGEGDTRKRNLTPETMQQFASKLAATKREASELNLTPSSVALRFCVSNPNVSCVIAGIRTAEQAIQNAAACEPLPDEVMQRLFAA
jgi:aryl-alcohol dehydrogenase-like predicted oxidoreductase